MVGNFPKFNFPVIPLGKRLLSVLYIDWLRIELVQ
jgi:hypothetical protein